MSSRIELAELKLSHMKALALLLSRERLTRTTTTELPPPAPPSAPQQAVARALLTHDQLDLAWETARPATWASARRWYQAWIGGYARRPSRRAEMLAVLVDPTRVERAERILTALSPSLAATFRLEDETVITFQQRGEVDPAMRAWVLGLGDSAIARWESSEFNASMGLKSAWESIKRPDTDFAIAWLAEVWEVHQRTLPALTEGPNVFRHWTDLRELEVRLVLAPPVSAVPREVPVPPFDTTVYDDNDRLRREVAVTEAHAGVARAAGVERPVVAIALEPGTDLDLEAVDELERIVDWLGRSCECGMPHPNRLSVAMTPGLDLAAARGLVDYQPRVTYERAYAAATEERELVDPQTGLFNLRAVRPKPCLTVRGDLERTRCERCERPLTLWLPNIFSKPSYKRRYRTSCGTCKSVWTAGQWTWGCRECGGGALLIPCHLCSSCGRSSRRNIAESRGRGIASWVASCSAAPAPDLLTVLKPILADVACSRLVDEARRDLQLFCSDRVWTVTPGGPESLVVLIDWLLERGVAIDPRTVAIALMGEPR
ncbi:MAG: hypothetical protein U0271_43610 [Polyangiaceae bacterium]